MERLRGALADVTWGFLVWELLTWTATVEFAVVGLAVAALAALATGRLGSAPGPWVLLRLRRLRVELRLAWVLLRDVTAANLAMARRVWSPSRLRTGIVAVAARERSTSRLAAIGLLSSLVVENQVVDIDPSSGDMLYHCVEVPSAEERYDEIVGHIEPLVTRL